MWRREEAGRAEAACRARFRRACKHRDVTPAVGIGPRRARSPDAPGPGNLSQEPRRGAGCGNEPSTCIMKEANDQDTVSSKEVYLKSSSDLAALGAGTTTRIGRGRVAARGCGVVTLPLSLWRAPTARKNMKLRWRAGGAAGACVWRGAFRGATRHCRVSWGAVRGGVADN